jgi:hypothetical protein
MSPAPAGELIVQSGRQQGTRRPLQASLTFIGQARGCDLRLKGSMIAPVHCLLLWTPGGLELRDLGAPAGTFVNGNRVGNTLVHDGDLLAIGPYQFRVSLPAALPQPEQADPPAEAVDALRVQAAAVAAQQAVLGEEEARLHQRLQSLEHQEEQLSGHLEEKRRLLVQIQERTEAERKALNGERSAYEEYVDRVTNDLTQAQRELVDQQQQVQAERRRVFELQRRLKQRWLRNWRTRHKDLARREEEAANEECNLAKERERLGQQQQAFEHERLHFNGSYELGRRQLLDGWSKLRRAQANWRQRRRQERAVLGVNGRDLEQQAIAITEARRLLEQEQAGWSERRRFLEKEVDGLNTRACNQRDKILEQQQELSRLEALLRQRRQELATAAAAADGQVADKALETTTRTFEAAFGAPATPSSGALVPVLPGADLGWQQRLAELDRLAGDLADQRLQLAAQWELLLKTQERWQHDRDQAAGDLETLGQKLQEQEQFVTAREQACCANEEILVKKHREIVHLRQHIIGWGARLRSRESSWDLERTRLLAEMKEREALAERQLRGLVDIRRRWAQQRRQEVDKLRCERAGCEGLRYEYAALRLEWQRRRAALEDDRRILAEKTLTMEQYRQEALTRIENPAGQRRLERLRRRWLTHNAHALRAVKQERQALEGELLALEARFAEAHKRAGEAAEAALTLADRQTAWEKKKVLLAARFSQLQQELKGTRERRACAEKQLARLKEDIERIARELLDEPDPPSIPMGQAA